MRLRTRIAVGQATRILLLHKPPFEHLKMSEQNIMLALNDPNLTEDERTALLNVLVSIRAALQRCLDEEQNRAFPM